MRPALAIVAALAVVLGCASASAQAGSDTVDELIQQGIRLYSEDLEFERATEVFARAADSPAASSGQRLEALEFLAACFFATGNEQSAREALRRLLAVDPAGRLHDPSHPPELLEMLEALRAEERAELPDYEPPTVGAGRGSGPVEGGGGPEGPSIEDYYREPVRSPWYRTWWFWTITGAVVAAGVTTAVVLSVPAGVAEPPGGSLEPGRVALPCSGLRF